MGSPVEVCHNDGDGEGYAENLLSKLVIYTERSKKKRKIIKIRFWDMGTLCHMMIIVLSLVCFLCLFGFGALQHPYFVKKH